MKRKRSRALLGTTIAAALATAGLVAGPAQANTTLPGINGKIAFTTNARTFSEGEELSATDKGGTPEQACFSPIPLMAQFIDFPSSDALDCGAEINTINPDGSSQAAVTNDFFPDDAPAWSPQDGSRIAYQTSDGENCTNPETITDCNYDIWTSAADGTDPHQVTSGPVNELHPSYSPDGGTIAFDGVNPIIGSTSGASTKDQDGVDPVAQQLDHLAQVIYTVPAAGGTPTLLEPESEINESQNPGVLVSDSQPAWSPDGSQIAFTRLSFGEPQVQGAADSKVFGLVTASMGTYVAPASGGPSHEIGSSSPCVMPIDVVPVVLAAARSGDVQAAAREASAATTREISEDCTFDAAPAWSPDGSKIAVERLHVTLGDEDTDIVVMNSADGSGEVNLSNVTEPADCADACGYDQKPAWSPDGTKIAFFSDRGADGLYPDNCQDTNGCDDEIWTMNADGSSPVQVTNNDVNDINPDWQRIPPPSPAPVVQPVVTPPAKPAVAPKVGVAGVRRACVAHSFHLRFTIATTASAVKSVVVKLDGKRIKSSKRAKFTLTINSKKLKAGRHRLTITATDTNGKVKTLHRTFSVCKAAKPRRHSAPRFTG